MRRNLVERLPLTLVLAAAVQLALLASSSIIPLADAAWQVRQDPAPARGAALSFGDSFRAYIGFLEATVPEDALVVIPPTEHDQVFGHMGLMQYFLFPRRLTNCPKVAQWHSCKQNYGGELTYILSMGGFPPPDESVESKQYVPHDEDHGVFVPVNSVP